MPIEIEPEEVTEEGCFFTEYDITSSPNDFNVSTLVNFIEKGIFVIPSFQRNYVWDLNRASKLIESLILGLPVPQIFLYEQGKNQYLVIDGQQRLMSIYYFIKQRFPRLEKRNELRRLFDEQGNIPEAVLADPQYFTEFKLKLVSKLPEERSKLNGLCYDTLGDWQTTLDLRTIRCIFVKQNLPKEDDSSIFEIFNRLNTGGVNLTPQEIRTSLYHSEFMRMMAHFNADERWRKLLNEEPPDLHLCDMEMLLRGFAMLKEGEQYKPSLKRFLNSFAKSMQDAQRDELGFIKQIFENFLNGYEDYPSDTLITPSTKNKNNKNKMIISVSVFEAIFYAACVAGYRDKTGTVLQIPSVQINWLKSDPEFTEASKFRTTSSENIRLRLRRACEILQG